jgi:peroxiredoxin
MALFRWSGITPPLYPQIWQFVGITVFALGVGYGIASRDPLRYWPLVVIGFATKSASTLGLLWTALGEQVPWPFAVAIGTNDAVWIVPLALILRTAFIRWRLEEDRRIYEQAAEVLLETVETNRGESVAAMSRRGPVLLAFLRHTGCPFCREAAADLARDRKILRKLGIQMAIVHMDDDEAGELFFAAHNLDDVPRVSDPDRTLYRAFKLRRGQLRQLFGTRIWTRALAAARQGHWPGLLRGDSFQMPGLFLIRDGEIMRSFRYETAADRPDYADFVCGLSDNDDSGQSSHGDRWSDYPSPGEFVLRGNS